MRRLAAFSILIALVMGLTAPAVTQAQSGTPSSDAAAPFGIPLGTAASYVGSDGAPIGTITVTNITDSFQGFDTSSAPQRGYHYAVAEVTVTNTGTAPIAFDPSYIEAIDSDGFVAQQASITYTDPTLTALEYTEALAPGASATGVIPYSMFGNTTIERMAYDPSYDRFITVLDLRTAPVVAGTPVSIVGTDGTNSAEVTVNGATAPFQGYDSSSAPPRGSSYVALDVTVTNTGTGVLSVSPADFWLIDRDGFVLSSASVTRTDTTVPDYTYVDLNPGDSQHGILVYPIFAGVPPAQVNYGDGYTSLNVVADLSAGMGTPAVSTVPTASATETGVAGVPTVAAPPVATTAAVASSPDCEGLVEWSLDLIDRISKAAELTAPLQVADVSTIDPASIRDVATQLRAYGDEQAASNPPAAAVELNTLMSEQFYYALADATDAIAQGLEQSNQTAALAGKKAAEDVVKIFDDGGAFDVATAALTAACPNEINLLNQQGS